MSDFRCEYYYYDGKWRCRRGNSEVTLGEYEKYCSNKYGCCDCPYKNGKYD